MIKKIIPFFEKADGVLVFLGNISIILMLLLISMDTIGRYAFNYPITGTYEIVTMYLFAGVVFLGLSNGMKEKSHITVNVVVDKFPINVKYYISIITNLVMLFFFTTLFYVSWIMAYDAFINKEYYYGVVSFPLFPAYSIVPLGTMFMVARIIINLIHPKEEKEGVDLS